MSEFATSAALDVTVSPDSLRQARGTIEDELGDVQVDVSSSTGGSSGGRMAGRERAMGRQLQTEANEHLSGIDDYGAENLDLNRERNDLLHQLVDATEKDAQTTRGRGGGMGGALGLAIGGIGLGSVLLSGLGSKISDAIPDLKPSDVVDSVSVGVSDVVDSAASIEVANVISSAVSLTPAALIASTAAVTASDVIGSPATISAGDVIAEATSIAPTDLITEAASMTPAVLVAEAATITVSSVIDAAAEISPGDVVASAVSLVPSDIVSGKISASDIVDRVVEPVPSPDGSTALAAGGAAGATTAAGAAAKRYGIPGAIRGGAGKVAGVTTPLITRGMTGLGPNEAPDIRNGGTREVDLKSNKEWIRDALSGPADPNAGPTAADDPNQWKTTPTNSTPYPVEPGDIDGIGSTETTLEQTNNFEINADTSDLEREASKKFKDFDKRLSDLERALNQ